MLSHHDMVRDRCRGEADGETDDLVEGPIVVLRLEPRHFEVRVAVHHLGTDVQRHSAAAAHEHRSIALDAGGRAAGVANIDQSSALAPTRRASGICFTTLLIWWSDTSAQFDGIVGNHPAL